MNTHSESPLRQLSVRLTPATHTKIKELANRLRVPQSEIIEAAFNLNGIGDGIRQVIASNLEAEAQRLRSLPPQQDTHPVY